MGLSSLHHNHKDLYKCHVLGKVSKEWKRPILTFPLSLPYETIPIAIRTAPAQTDHVDIVRCGDVEWCKDVFGVNNIPV